MPFDRSAHRRQVARVVTHAAGRDVLLRLEGKGEPVPATITAERPGTAQVLPDQGARRVELVTIPAASFDGRAQPREGQHFTDPAGRVYRIQEDRSVSHHATLVYAVSSAPAAA